MHFIQTQTAIDVLSMLSLHTGLWINTSNEYLFIFIVSIEVCLEIVPKLFTWNRWAGNLLNFDLELRKDEIILVGLEKPVSPFSLGSFFPFFITKRTLNLGWEIRKNKSLRSVN